MLSRRRLSVRHNRARFPRHVREKEALPMASALMASAVLCVLAASCASERLIEQSGPTPVWAIQVPEATDTELRFAGQALGRNVLDEKTMRSRAMEDVRHQVAGLISTKVEVQSTERLRRRGYAPHGTDKVVKAEYISEIRTHVAQRVRGVAQRGKYWEKWHIDPGLFRRSFVRYKYFVLGGYAKEEYERSVRSFARLLSDQFEAAALMKQGKANAAAQLLERLLNDYPGASVSIRLKLADAYEQAQKLGRAAGVLKVAVKLTTDVAQRARIRERINHLDATFPNLDGASAYVAADVDEFMGGDLDTVKAWIEELFAASRIRLVGVKFGVGDTALSQQLATARKAGAKWFVTVKLRKMPLEATKSVYDAVLHQVRFECSVRLRSTENEGMLSSKSATERGLAADRDMAARSAAKCALRSALRQCFLALVSSASAQ